MQGREGRSYCPHLLWLGFGLAAAALSLLALTGLGVRLGMRAEPASFAIFNYAGYLGLFATPVALTGFTQAVKWSHGPRTLLALLAMVMAMVSFFVPHSYKQGGQTAVSVSPGHHPRENHSPGATNIHH